MAQSSSRKPASEPQPLDSVTPFEPWDFEALGPHHARNPEANDHRLRTRRKLLSLAKASAARMKAEDLPLDVRTSLHNPHAFNGKKVERLWAYLVRPKAEKTKLRKVLGRDLAKDLDNAYRNAYLCLAVESDRLEVSLRIHVDAWYDGQNLIKRVKSEGVHGWLQVLNTLSGFQLRLHDWKGEWACGDLTPERLEEFLRFYVPGEHQLVVDRRWPVPPTPAGREAVMGDDVPTLMADELLRLVPLYRYLAWSDDSNFLFSG